MRRNRCTLRESCYMTSMCQQQISPHCVFQPELESACRCALLDILRHHRNHGPISVFFNHVASASSLRGIRPPHVSIRAIVVDASLRVSSGSYLGQRRHRHRIPPLDRRAASAPGHLLLFHPRMGAVGHMGRRAASAAGLLILVCPRMGALRQAPGRMGLSARPMARQLPRGIGSVRSLGSDDGPCEVHEGPSRCGSGEQRWRRRSRRQQRRRGRGCRWGERAAALSQRCRSRGAGRHSVAAA